MNNSDSDSIFSIIFIVVLVLWGVYKFISSKILAQRIAFIEAYVFPQQMAKRLHEKYPHLSDAQVNQVMDALRNFFTLCSKAKMEMVSMPSQVVDEAWHEFILFTRQYEEFCQNALGRFLHHTPAEAMKAPTEAQQGIQRAWQLACEHERINVKAPEKLPQLFAIDTLLMIDDGFNYVLDCTVVEGQQRPHADAGTATHNKKPVYCAAHISPDSGCGGGCGGG